MIENTCWVYFESSSHELTSVWFECQECLWASGQSCDWTASSLAGWLRPLRRRSATQDNPSFTSLIIQRPLGPFERAAISLKNSPRSTPTWWSSITPAPPPTLPDTSAMSTAAQGVLQITRWHYCMEHRVNRSTIFDFDPFYIFSPGKTITLLIFPFLHDGGLFPWRYNPSLGWKNRTGLHRAPISALSNTPTDGWTKAPDLINRLHGGESSMKRKASQSPIPSPSINKSIKYFIDPWWSHSRQARTASH